MEALDERMRDIDARVARLEDYTARLGSYVGAEHEFVAHLARRMDHADCAAMPARPTAPPARPRAETDARRPDTASPPQTGAQRPETASPPQTGAQRPETASRPVPERLYVGQRPAAPRPAWRADLEDLLGGRLLGLAGGVAVLLGIAFFVAVAIGRGWIDEPARVILALAASLALTAGGALLYERRGRTQAALVMVGAGIAGVFLALIAATQLYGLVPAPVALASALAAGALATALAVRWDARTIGALGILGALLAPVLVGAGSGGGTVAFLAVALLAAVGVLLWRRWEWLSVGAFAVVAPQLAAWAYEEPSTLGLLVAPAVFWALFAGAAFGYELRVRAPRPRPSSVGLLLAAGALCAGVAWGGLDYAGERALGDGFLALLALAHLALGVAALRSRRVARAFGLVSFAGAVALGDVAFALVFSGPVEVAGWAMSAVLLAALGRVAAEDRDLLRLGLGAQLALATIHALTVDATPGALAAGDADLPTAVSALGLVALAAFACARLDGGPRAVRFALDGVAMAAVAYLTAFALDGAALATAWGAQAVALGQVARRHADAAAGVGSLAFLGLAALHLLAFVVAPEAAFSAPPGPTDPLLALAAVAAAAFARARQQPGTGASLACDALAATLLAFGTAVALDGPALAIAWAAEAALLVFLAARLRGFPATHGVGFGSAPTVRDPGRETAGAGRSGATAGDLDRETAGAGRSAATAGDLDGETAGAGRSAATAGGVAVPRPDVVAFLAALGFAGLALLHALVFDAPPEALVVGVDDLTGAAGALLALAAAGFGAARLAPTATWRNRGAAVGAAALVYLGSVAVITAFQPDALSFHSGIAGLEVGQEGQVLLSAFWGTVGLGALLAGLVLGRRPARVAGLALLVLAIAKVFAFDLASLDSIYRVLSLVGLGLVLLAGAYAWQRLRPGPVRPASLAR